MKIRRIPAVLLAMIMLVNTAAYAGEIQESNGEAAVTQVKAENNVSIAETEDTDAGGEISEEASSEISDINAETVMTVSNEDAAGDEAAAEEESSIAEVTESSVTAENSLSQVSETKEAETTEVNETPDNNEEDLVESTVETSAAEMSTSDNDVSESSEDTEVSEPEGGQNENNEAVVLGIDDALITVKTADTDTEEDLHMLAGNKADLGGSSGSKDEDNGLTEGISYTIDYNSVKFEKVSNHPYAENEEVSCSLNFTFSDSDSEQYECYITGIKIKPGDLSAVLEGVNGSDDANQYRSTILTEVKSIVAAFFKESKYSLTSDPKESNWFDLYDAEKYSWASGTAQAKAEEEKTTEEAGKEAGQNYGDSYLCWAASASDILAYTGWAKTSDAGDEDAVMTDFEKAFSDNTSDQECGIGWYLGGVNYFQSVDSETGKAYIPDNPGENGGAQERGNNSTFSGPVNKIDYAPSNVISGDSFDVGDSLDNFNKVVSDIKNGDGVALGLLYMADGERLGGHALTVFGYIKNIVKDGIDLIKSIFVADSDSDVCYEGNTPEDTPKYSDIKNAEANEETRNKAVNKYTIKYVYDYTLHDQTGIYTTYALREYAAQTQGDGVAEAVVILRKFLSYNNVAENFSVETEGTGDAMTTGDIIPSFSSKVKTTAADEKTEVNFVIRNSSYVPIESNGSNLMMNYTCFVYDENYNIIDSETKLTAFPASRLNALQNYIIPNEYTFSQSGTYYYGVSVNSIGYYDENESWVSLPEAYYTNNKTDRSALMRINVEQKKMEKKENTIQYESAVSVENTYYSVKSGLPLVYKFYCPGIKDAKELKLTADNGTVISPDNYTVIINADGTITVTLKPEFLKTLVKNKYSFVLYWKSRTISVFQIRLI